MYKKVSRKSVYPEHQRKVQNNVWAHKSTLLIKVPSHLDKKGLPTIKYNEIADNLATIATKFSFQNRDFFRNKLSPEFKSANFSKCWLEDRTSFTASYEYSASPMWDTTGIT